jgi:hypothetical protein
MKVRVHHRDEHYWLEEYTQRHATMHLAYVEIADADWRDYWAHVEECREWNDWMRELEGEQYAKDHPDEQGGNISLMALHSKSVSS